MSDLFDALTAEQRAQLIARGWRSSPFASVFGRETWEAPDGTQYTEAEARAQLARLEKEKLP